MIRELDKVRITVTDTDGEVIAIEEIEVTHPTCILSARLMPVGMFDVKSDADIALGRINPKK